MIKTYDGGVALHDSTKKNKIHLSVLIAETSLWANPEVHRYLLSENGFGSFYPNTRRYRQGQGEKKGMVLEGVRLDDNTYANYAIKKAIGIPRVNLLGYAVCHIWPLTCYDVRYHTNIANLVLIPSAIAGLSDHDAEIRATLQYRAYELYNWHPKEEKAPREPSYYPNCWKEPFPFTEMVENSLKRRSGSNQSMSTHSDNEKTIKSNNQVKSQRDMMWELWQECAQDKEKTIRAYALAERQGKVKRSKNSLGLNSEDYARRLWSDGVQKGWLSE